MPPRRRKRLDPSLFAIPVDQVRTGAFSDKYFVRARDVLRADGHSPRVTLQISCKSEAVLSGIDEAIAILKQCADNWGALAVHALYEGDRVESWDTVMTIEGVYDNFAALETLYLGSLSRRTRIATNTRQVVDAARPKSVLYFSARQDHWTVQAGDGWAAHIGGATSVSTDAQGAWVGKEGTGTIPHALIAAYGGDTVRATRAFAAHIGEAVPLVALVDYANDCVGASLDVARAMGERLWGVRLDTSEFLVDQSIVPQMGAFRPTGVNPALVWNVRNALDGEGFGDVKIVVSGGFTADRIRAFEEEGVPVDAYGVGTSLLGGHVDFTADIVMVDGVHQAKVGRELRTNPKLERVK